MNNLPNDIFIHIYKFVFKNTLDDLKNKLNGIQLIHNTKLYKTSYQKTITINWNIPIISFQNHHIYSGINIMEYTDFRIFTNDSYIENKIPIYEEIKGDCWEDLCVTANKLIYRTDDYCKCNIDSFTINSKTIRLNTSYI